MNVYLFLNSDSTYSYGWHFCMFANYQERGTYSFSNDTIIITRKTQSVPYCWEEDSIVYYLNSENLYIIKSIPIMHCNKRDETLPRFLYYNEGKLFGVKYEDEPFFHGQHSWFTKESQWIANENERITYHNKQRDELALLLNRELY